MEKKKVGYDNGEWIASTLGFFVQMLVDAGDPAVVFRVVEDSKPDENGKFTRKIECVLLPDGYVKGAVKDGDRIHKILLALLQAGLVK